MKWFIPDQEWAQLNVIMGCISQIREDYCISKHKHSTFPYNHHSKNRASPRLRNSRSHSSFDAATGFCLRVLSIPPNLERLLGNRIASGSRPQAASVDYFSWFSQRPSEGRSWNDRCSLILPWRSSLDKRHKKGQAGDSRTLLCVRGKNEQIGSTRTLWRPQVGTGMWHSWPSQLLDIGSRISCR